MAVFSSILFKINVTQNMPKLAKSVQMRHKVSKYVATAQQQSIGWGIAGDRNASAECLSMVYTVYNGVDLGMGIVAADLHDTTQTVNINLTHLRVVPDLDPQVDGRDQRIKTIFVTLIESPYTTLYQTVRTGHDLSSGEISQADSIKKGVSNFGEPHNRTANPPGSVLSNIKRRSLSSLLDRIPSEKEPCYSC